MNDDNVYMYLGRARCGCIRYASVDSADRRRDLASAIAKCIRDGLTIERLPLEQAREVLNADMRAQCPHQEAR